MIQSTTHKGVTYVQGQLFPTTGFWLYNFVSQWSVYLNILDTHLRISREWRELELGCTHEDGTVSTIIVIQQRSERLVYAAVACNVAVAWWGGWWHSQGHPAIRCIADRTILTAHAVGPATKTIVGHCSNDQGQLQNQLFAAWDVHVNL